MVCQKMRFWGFHVESDGGPGPESVVPEEFGLVSVVDTAFGPRGGGDEGKNGEV